MRIVTPQALAAAATVAATTAILIGQNDGVSVAGHLSISTSSTRRASAVSVRQNATGSVEAMFCVSHLQPPAEKLAYEGAGTVVYRPRPIPGLPPGVKISGPETIAPVLAVLPSEGKAMLFLGQGESSPVPASDPSMKTVATFKAGSIVRQDWRAPDGGRRGTSVESCLSPGG